MDNLPIELLAKIFEYIPLDLHYQHLYDVSIKWRHLIQERQRAGTHNGKTILNIPGNFHEVGMGSVSDNWNFPFTLKYTTKKHICFEYVLGISIQAQQSEWRDFYDHEWIINLPSSGQTAYQLYFNNQWDILDPYHLHIYRCPWKVQVMSKRINILDWAYEDGWNRTIVEEDFCNRIEITISLPLTKFLDYIKRNIVVLSEGDF